MAYIDYPDWINGPYELVEYELGGFEPCDKCGNEHPAIVNGESGGVGIYCMECGNAVAGLFRGREVKGKVPPVKHGTYEHGEIRAARRWNNAMHWVQDGKPEDDTDYFFGDGIKRVFATGGE